MPLSQQHILRLLMLTVKMLITRTSGQSSPNHMIRKAILPAVRMLGSSRRAPLSIRTRTPIGQYAMESALRMKHAKLTRMFAPCLSVLYKYEITEVNVEDEQQVYARTLKSPHLFILCSYGVRDGIMVPLTPKDRCGSPRTCAVSCCLLRPPCSFCAFLCLKF